MQDITRKKDTGEPGNPGQFGSTPCETSGLTLATPAYLGPYATLQQMQDAGGPPVKVPGDPEVVVLLDNTPGGCAAQVLVPFDVDSLVDTVTDGASGYRGRAKQWALRSATSAAQAGLGDPEVEAVEHDGRTWLSVPFDAEGTDTATHMREIVVSELGLPGRDLEYDLQIHLDEVLRDSHR